MNPGEHMYPVQLHSRSNQAEKFTQANITNERAAADCGHQMYSEGADVDTVSLAYIYRWSHLSLQAA